MRTYKSINDTSNFSLHDGRLSKAYIKDNQDILFEFDKDGIDILGTNKENLYDKTLRIKDVAISYKDVDFDSSRIFIYERVRLFRKTVLTIRKQVSWEQFCKNINNEKWNLEIIDETYGYKLVKLTGYIYRGNGYAEFSLDIFHWKDIEYFWNEFEEERYCPPYIDNG